MTTESSAGRIESSVGMIESSVDVSDSKRVSLYIIHSECERKSTKDLVGSKILFVWKE
jgi:hypothetical protein